MIGRRNSMSWKPLPGSVVASETALAFSQAMTSSPAGESPENAKGTLAAVTAAIAAPLNSNLRRFCMAVTSVCRNEWLFGDTATALLLPNERIGIPFLWPPSQEDRRRGHAPTHVDHV